ncbi:AAA family ATPase [Amphritea sp. 2_MG-2023]|uniref:ParA family protein n=1 Tax=Amphritea TaxID=515417 RepID=UPI001C06B710|nr:AAA family ATPase [Amphritea sp. 2_MG-2023]MBU2967678.1 AAA family ATPase [Amphritea atlantica]MDO6417005.1 AAA family ATPase [Amphritea sp. 2_MG-2023]MDX2422105.1 AAA family ATPase [Amphritea sp.]
MTKILTITNQKGGVGKTTTCVNLAASLAATKKRVLMIDMDPQGNATMGSGVDKHHLKNSVYEVLIGEATMEESIITDAPAGYDLVGANGDLTAAEVELLQLPRREFRMKMALEKVKANYDFILIDNPPSLNLLTVNALAASSGVIIPMQCEYYALEGISSLVGTINKINKRLNPSLKIEGILRTMFDPRMSLTKDVSDHLVEYFGDQVYRTVIPRNVRLAEAPSHGLPALMYDKNSRGSVAYLALAGELIRKSKQHDKKQADKQEQED